MGTWACNYLWASQSPPGAACLAGSLRTSWRSGVRLRVTSEGPAHWARKDTGLFWRETPAERLAFTSYGTLPVMLLDSRMSPRPLCAQACWGQGGRKELNAAAPGLKKPRLLFSWLLLEHFPLVPDELGGARMTFLASAFNSLGSPHSQPWHLVLASSPGLLSLGEVAWQRHPTWEKMTKESLREKGRK